MAIPSRPHPRASSGSPCEASIGFSRAIRVGNHIHLSGTAPLEPDGSSTPGDAEAPARRCLASITSAIESLGGSAADVVRTRMALVDPADADADAVGRAHGAVFSAIRPAATMVAGAVLPRPEWRVGIEADAFVGDAR